MRHTGIGFHLLGVIIACNLPGCDHQNAPVSKSLGVTSDIQASRKATALLMSGCDIHKAWACRLIMGIADKDVPKISSTSSTLDENVRNSVSAMSSQPGSALKDVAWWRRLPTQVDEVFVGPSLDGSEAYWLENGYIVTPEGTRVAAVRHERREPFKADGSQSDMDVVEINCLTAEGRVLAYFAFSGRNETGNLISFASSGSAAMPSHDPVIGLVCRFSQHDELGNKTSF